MQTDWGLTCCVLHVLPLPRDISTQRYPSALPFSSNSPELRLCLNTCFPVLGAILPRFCYFYAEFWVLPQSLCSLVMVPGVLFLQTGASDDSPVSLDIEYKMSSQTVASCLIFSIILVFYLSLLSFHPFFPLSLLNVYICSQMMTEETSADMQSYWSVTPRNSSSNKTVVLPPVALLNWGILLQVPCETLQVSGYSSSDQQQIDFYI